MSRGLGCLQRAILTALAARPGGDTLEDNRGYRAWLAHDVHDLRKISREMAKKMSGISHCHYVTEAWQASFSRAVASLSKRSLIEILWLVPLRGIEPEFEIPNTELADGVYMTWFSRQRRFVGMRPDFITLSKAAASKYCASSVG